MRSTHDVVRLRFLAIAAPGAGADPAPRALLQQARRRADAAEGVASPTAPRRRYLSKSATKRLPLTSKRARKGYYKGVGSRSTGRHTSKGKFIIDERKVVRLARRRARAAAARQRRSRAPARRSCRTSRASRSSPTSPPASRRCPTRSRPSCDGEAAKARSGPARRVTRLGVRFRGRAAEVPANYVRAIASRPAAATAWRPRAAEFARASRSAVEGRRDHDGLEARGLGGRVACARRRRTRRLARCRRACDFFEEDIGLVKSR